MKVCLLTAPTATDFEDPLQAETREPRRYAATPQLGILALAAVLEANNSCPDIINLNHAYYCYLAGGGRGVAEFAPWAASLIASTHAEIYGFSSISCSYPASIRIAACLKRADPGSIILFGGPQASVVDEHTLRAFPFVDFVLRGEADMTLLCLLNELSGGRQLSAVPGLTWRSPFGVQRNPSAPVIQILDDLPLPAFHLTGELEHLKAAPLELGRGCPFACTFCSTNDFFRRKFRLKSPERMLADMRAVASRWGIRAFDLTHDMFTVDRRRVVAFCDCMISSGENFSWGCSARTDCVDEELLGLMAKAGCGSVFFGVESGSQRMQRLMEKDLDVSHARQIIAITHNLGMGATVSLISGFPEENPDDLRTTVDMYMYALRHERITSQFNVLAPLAETPIHRRYRHQLTLEELCSDVGHQGGSQNELDRELIREHPEIFPNFYLVPTPYLDRSHLLELREFLLMGRGRVRWLFVALHQESSGLFDFFSAWRKDRIRRMPDLRGFELRAYYMGRWAQKDLLQFARCHLGKAIPSAVECLIRVYEAHAEATEADSALLCVRPGKPIRSKGVHVLQLDWDVRGVIERLGRGERVPTVDRTVHYFRTIPCDENSHLIESTQLINAALQLCDGQTSIAAVVEILAGAFQASGAVRRRAAKCLLETLEAEGLIHLHGKSEDKIPVSAAGMFPVADVVPGSAC